MSIALILLAAGQSRRMGNVDKLSCDLGGKPLLQFALDAAEQSRATPILLVHGGTKPNLGNGAVDYVYAAHAHLGQTHSLQAGLQALSNYPDTSGTLVTLGDMPFVTAAHIDRLYAAATNSPDQICRPFVDALPGHPVYWPKSYFPDLMALKGDDGAKPIFQRETIHKIVFDTNDVTFDVDTPQRLEEARERLFTLL